MRATCGERFCMAARMSAAVMNGPRVMQASRGGGDAEVATAATVAPDVAAAGGCVEEPVVAAAGAGTEAVGAAGCRAAAFLGISDHSRNSATPGSVGGGNVRTGARPNHHQAAAPRFKATSNRNSKRTNIIFPVRQGSGF